MISIGLRINGKFRLSISTLASSGYIKMKVSADLRVEVAIFRSDPSPPDGKSWIPACAAQQQLTHATACIRKTRTELKNFGRRESQEIAILCRVLCLQLQILCGCWLLLCEAAEFFDT